MLDLRRHQFAAEFDLMLEHSPLVRRVTYTRTSSITSDIGHVMRARLDSVLLIGSLAGCSGWTSMPASFGMVPHDTDQVALD